MQEWKAKLQDLMDQITHVRRAIEAKFSGYGYQEGNLADLAHDMSQLYGACLTLTDQIRSLLDDPERDSDLVGAALSKIEATLQDARFHLEALSQSLSKFNRFLSDIETPG